MKLKKSAFTMIELVFVIVVLGILAAVAIPKFAATRTDAVITKGRSDVMSLRSAISAERQKRFMKGDNNYINHLDGIIATAPAAGTLIFDNNGTTANTLITYGITTKNFDGGWMKTGTNRYTYNVSGVITEFDYNATNGTFDCTAGTANCDQLTK